MKEYLILEKYDRSDLETAINEKAKDGWYLHSVFARKRTGNDTYLYAILEREVLDNPSTR